MQHNRVAKSSLPAHAWSERRLARDVLPLRPCLRFRWLGVTRSNERLGSRLGLRPNSKQQKGVGSRTPREEQVFKLFNWVNARKERYRAMGHKQSCKLTAVFV